VQYLHLLSQITVNTSEIGEDADQIQSSQGGTSFTGNTEFLIKNIHFFSDKCIQEDQRKKLLNSEESGQRIMIYQFFFINYLLSVCTVDVVRQAHKNAGAASQSAADAKNKLIVGERSISQRIFIILLKLLEALGDQELNSQIDSAIMNRVESLEKFNEEKKEDGQGAGDAKKGGLKTQDEKAPKKRSSNSATMTIIKMILFNLDKLLRVSKEVQDGYTASTGVADRKKESADVLTHKLQTIQIDEDQLELLVKLLTQHEQHGEIVNKVYECLYNVLEVSRSISQAHSNIAVIDMSKGLLQICIKHSSIYQCENAFNFLHQLVLISDKYQNKQDIEFSLTKIKPASLQGANRAGQAAEDALGK